VRGTEHLRRTRPDAPQGSQRRNLVISVPVSDLFKNIITLARTKRLTDILAA
jgi:hypothetical protein